MSTTATASKANPRTRRPRRSKTRHQLDAQSKQAVKQLIRYWAREFRFSQGRTVEAIVKHGAKLNEGRKALIETLGHGHWLAALEEAGIGERTAQMYMRIAIQPWANPQNYAVLPATVYALNYLAGLQSEFVQDLLDEMRLSHTMTKNEVVALVEPAPAEDASKKPAKKRTPKGLEWPTSVDATVKTFFGGAFDCDTRDPEAVVWRRDDESIAYAASRTDSNGFHNRVRRGAVVFFPLGQKVAIFYEGERRDEFVAAFGEHTGHVMEAIGSSVM